MSNFASTTASIPRRAGGLVILPAALLLGSLGTASTAKADAADTAFLAGLQSEGITDHVSPAHAILAAHMVCQQIEDGKSPNDVVGNVITSTSMPAYHAGYFVGAAIDAYCPEYKSKLPAGGA